MSGQIGKIEPTRAAATLASDAEGYARLALELGAHAARVIPASHLVIDERVVFKCAVPTCFGYGTSANCPPHSPAPDKMREIAARYDVAVVFKLDVPPEVIVRDRATIEDRVGAYKRVFSIAGALESTAFYDGHYLSAGLAAGSCKSTFCHDQDCAVLSRQKCRHNLIARPSMEAVGIDSFALAAGLGWDIYPVGSSASSADIPAASLLGLVLVG